MTNFYNSIHDLAYGRQHNRILRLSFPNNDAPAAQILVNTIDAIEYLSKNFEFTVELLSDDANIPLKDLQGKLLNIELVRADGGIRYFSGYVFSFRHSHSDGNLTFYEAKLGPWLNFLSLRKDNYLFHGKNLRDQTESIFGDYSIYPRWDWQVTADDPVMTDACQFNESDFNYLSRRWEAKGWHYWYEHDAAGHKLIISSDSTQALSIDGSTEIRFQAESGSIEEDAINRWSPIRHVMASNVALTSFNFKNPTPSNVNVPTINKQINVPCLESHEYVGSYGFKNIKDGDSLSRIRMEELESMVKIIEAEGNSRFMMPGRWFRLTDHFNNCSRSWDRNCGKDEFLILSVHHVAKNNYLKRSEEKELYFNKLTCTRKSISWRPTRNFNSTDTRIFAPQTAIVVGPAGQDSIHTDEYGRIRVQFHWDRVGNNDDCSSAWIRVSSLWAGTELGATAIPRIGTEVIIQWLDGNPDRPIVMGAVFNEQNMPPWSIPAQKALTGFRSRELTPDHSNYAIGRSNHIILDDTHKKIQVQVKSDHQCSQLSLGYITRVENSQGRKDVRGEGWEIATNAWGVARAGQGMLITTEARTNAVGETKNMSETVQRLIAAREMQQTHAELAEKNSAQEKQGQQSDVGLTLQAQIDSIRGKESSPNEGNFPELCDPYLVLSSPAGIAATTAQSTHLASDINTAITTGESLSIATGSGLFATVRETFRLFVQKAGLKLVAAAGDIDVKALNEGINLLARLKITQTANQIILNAKQDILINGGGSYVKFGENGIEHGTKGNFLVHAASHNFVKANSMSPPDIKSNTVDIIIKQDLHLEYVDADGNPLRHDPIHSTSWNGERYENTLDEHGKTIIKDISRGSFRAEQPKRK